MDDGACSYPGRMTAVDVDTLRAAVTDCFNSLSFVAEHAEDNENPPALVELLCDLRDVKQAAAEAYGAVEGFLLAMDLPRQWETPVGVVEVKRATKRTKWDSEGLWRHLAHHVAPAHDTDPLAVLAECARPSWRVTGLRAFGVNPDEWCEEEPGAQSLVLPPRDLAERGKAA
jgi:hypothetical protein